MAKDTRSKKERENIAKVQGRELLMQGVFQMEIQKDGTFDQLHHFLLDKEVSPEQIVYIEGVYDRIIENIDEIDHIINKYSSAWQTNRLPKVDLAILRVAVGELVFLQEIPGPIIINDAVNMAKKFSDEDSHRYINGILGTVLKTTMK